MQNFRKKDLEKSFREYLIKIEEIFDNSTKELQESEKKYRAIVDEAADAIVLLNDKNIITSWNEGAQYIFGYKDFEAIGQDIDELISPDDIYIEGRELSRKLLGGEKIRSYETIRYAKGKVPRHVIISATPLKNERNQVKSIALIYKDITELQRAQENLIQSEKQATLGVIAGSIGHELNNIVGGLMVYAQLLKEKPDDTERSKQVANLFCEKLETISIHAKNLLSLSKPVKPEMSYLAIEDVLKQTTETLVISGVLKRFEISYEIRNDLPALCADRNLLEQVIRNLEINAAQAMGQVGVLTIGAHRSENHQYLEFYIRDTGPGISDEIQHKIFDKFFTTKSAGQGTGLGLPIIKQIIEQHSGYIRFKTAIGQGTTFFVGIPVMRPGES
ncbi:PAS domain S-box protein [candidate division KSB1 bacterium]|nr:PAS domain S-box protein [candidate division KSB1 bacterium]